MANATASSSIPSCGLLARMIFVPQKRKFLAASGWMGLDPRSSKRRDSLFAGILETGTDSPVLKFSKRIVVTNNRSTSKHALVNNTIPSK